MGSRINLDASLWYLYCFAETWGYIFKPPTRKMTKRSNDVNEKGDLLIFSSHSFSHEFENLLNYFWGKDLSFFSLLIKLFGHFNLSILRISSHFKWEFFVNAKNVVVFFVALCWANETLKFSFVEGSSSIFYF